MTCDYEWLGFCGHDHHRDPGTCGNCGRRTSEVDGWCRLCDAWLALLDADQRAGRGVLVKAGTDG